MVCLFCSLGCLEHFIFWEEKIHFSDKIQCIYLGLPTYEFYVTRSTVQSNLSAISAIITFFDIELLMGSELSIHNSQLALIKAFLRVFLIKQCERHLILYEIELVWTKTKVFSLFSDLPPNKESATLDA